ncbi:hypothetical protein [Streptomyces sparsus]
MSELWAIGTLLRAVATTADAVLATAGRAHQERIAFRPPRRRAPDH